MKAICFFTVGHNGDIFLSKSFIRDIVSQSNLTFLYHHMNNFKLTKDLPTISTNIAPTNYSYDEKFIETKNILFINIWLFPYILDQTIKNITIESHYKVYEVICEKINEVFNTQIKLKSIENYFPFTDTNFIETKNVDKYLKENTNKKVLVSNGLCLSGQSPYNGDMKPIIEKLSLEYKDITFIALKNLKHKLIIFILLMILQK
jgi:hypothetical protein